ncbi:MAG TPA: MBOAT family O-acyltransferase [Saprospiraceae bacterium]|nr:MBOAT family O-acyltransferase [Saprospiraceae bacterium]HMQ81456.1 MBOAT family O-acyltransferase [Saprospiraceae bacterium]
MVFNSIEFLIFFAVFLALYFAVPNRKFRLVLCLIGSYFFYGWWDWRFLSLIIASTFVDYYAGARIADTEDPIQRKRFLILSVVFNLGLLCTFKYLGWFVDNFYNITELLGVGFSRSTLSIILPLGISFYTFQTMSYTIDIYRRQLEPERDFLTFATYVAFFPQLVAGPIVRARELLPQFKEDKKFDANQAILGVGLILLGYFRKVVIADSVAPIVDSGFEHPELFNSINLIVFAFFFALQVYCDFAGYSDIAIGIAKIMGYKFPLNFNLPFFAPSFAEHWRRWHMTLTRWLRDYLFIPLGGSKGSNLMTIRNVMITMVLGGLWHGAKWTCVIWGALHGLYLIGERLFKPVNDFLYKTLPRSLVHWSSVMTVFALLCFAHMIFRSLDMHSFFVMAKGIFRFDNLDPMTIKNKAEVFKCIALIVLMFIGEYISTRVKLPELLLEKPAFRYISFASIVWLILLFGTFNENQFFYFQF